MTVLQIIVVRPTLLKNLSMFHKSWLPFFLINVRSLTDRLLNVLVNGIQRVAKKLGIDCAQAVVGFDFHCGFSHPV